MTREELVAMTEIGLAWMGCIHVGEQCEFEGGTVCKDICGFTLGWSPVQEKQ
jgi:hypothetical protein